MRAYSEMLLKGEGIKVDIKESANYLKKSDDAGNVRSMLEYAQMTEQGNGIPIDETESAKYCKIAAD